MSNAVQGYESVHIAWIDGDAVLLDLANDSYDCVLAGDDGWANLPSAQAVTAVRRAAGLPDLEPCDDSSTVTPVAWSDCPATAVSSLDWTIVVAFATAFVMSVWRFHRRPLAELVRYGARGGDGDGDGDGDDLVALAAVVEHFERLLIWLPVRPACLFRSLFLRDFIARRGHAAAWVFGVRLFPFRAHCWLAIGNVVIGDAAHRVLAYQPILTVGSAKA